MILSSPAKVVKDFLDELFPLYKITIEYYILYNKQKLFVDFFISDLALAIEVQGEQHEKFVPHFHGNASGWNRHKRRDNLKLAWAEENDITLLVVWYNDLPDSAENLLQRISEVQYG